MTDNPSLSELARKIERNQRDLNDAQQTAGTVPFANILAKLIDSCLMFLARQGELRQQIAGLEKQISSRDNAVRLLTLRLEASSTEAGKLRQQLSDQEARASGSAERSLKDQLDDIEQSQQLGVDFARTQARLLRLIAEQRQFVRDQQELLRDMVAEDNALIDGLRKMKEEDDADKRRE